MITNITRSRVNAQIGERAVTVFGEALIRTPGHPDFVLYENSVTNWDAPYESELIDVEQRKAIVATIKTEMEQKFSMAVELR